MRPEDAELRALIGRFVPVRITDFRDVDLNRFRFDYDLTFALLMMSPGGHTYSRFGVQDHTNSTRRMSVAGLKTAMRAVLDLHAREPAPPVPEQARKTLKDIPIFQARRAAKSECYHCHYAHDAEVAGLRAAGGFRKESLYRYPYPENIGLALDVDRNNRVESVTPGSSAEKAGVRSGDIILRAGSGAEAVRVFTSADLQFALERVPDPGSVTLAFDRAGRASTVTLALPAGWRRSDISWRPSQGEVPPIIGIWEQPLSGEEKARAGLGADRLALRVSFLFPGEKWVATRGELRLNDVVWGVNGEALPHMTPRQFHTWFRLKFNVGDKAVLNILRGGRRLAVTVPCLEVVE